MPTLLFAYVLHVVVSNFLQEWPDNRLLFLPPGVCLLQVVRFPLYTCKVRNVAVAWKCLNLFMIHLTKCSILYWQPEFEVL